MLHLHHWANLGDDLVRRAARRGIRSVVSLCDFHATCALTFRIAPKGEVCDRPQDEETCGRCVGPRSGIDESEVRFRIGTRMSGLRAELRAAVLATVPSESHRRAIAPHLPPGTDLRVLPLGSDELAELPRAPRSDALRVLHFGNLCRLKGVESLISAVNRAASSGARVHLALAGRIVEPDLNFGPIRHHGPYDSARLREIAAGCDLAAFPSFARESQGLVIDEALRLGLPVLVSDRGALKDRIGSKGRVLGAGDLDAWATELCRLAAGPAALAALRAGTPGRLTSHADHAGAVAGLYDEVRRRPVPAVDLETPLLRRLAYVERAFGDLVERFDQAAGHATA